MSSSCEAWALRLSMVVIILIRTLSPSAWRMLSFNLCISLFGKTPSTSSPRALALAASTRHHERVATAGGSHDQQATATPNYVFKPLDPVNVDLAG
eukprot:m.470676 g.470676  ORF g.470676 m.470676 type:complete len:96 (+) comp30101_c0_seq1:1493-1780(+)